MDSKTETVSDNELIAQFMGFVQSKSSLGNTWEHPERMGIYGGVGLKLKYDSSWDWLMPVVEKIESMKWSFRIDLDEATCYNYENKDLFKGSVFGRKGKLSAVYELVVEFIKWFNSQSPDTIK